MRARLRESLRGVYVAGTDREFHLRPYRDEPSASRPIRADKHRRGQRVLTWVTSREHCAAAGIFLLCCTMILFGLGDRFLHVTSVCLHRYRTSARLQDEMEHLFVAPLLNLFSSSAAVRLACSLAPVSRSLECVL